MREFVKILRENAIIDGGAALTWGRPQALFDVHLKRFNSCSSEDPLSQTCASCLCNPSFPMEIGIYHNISHFRRIFFLCSWYCPTKISTFIYAKQYVCYFLSACFSNGHVVFRVLIHADESLEGHTSQCGQKRSNAYMILNKSPICSYLYNIGARTNARTFVCLICLRRQVN